MLERAEQGGESPVAVADAADGMAEVLFNLSGLLSQEQADDAALIHLHPALALKPDFILAPVLLGEILQHHGRRAEAIAAYRRLPEASPSTVNGRLRIPHAVPQKTRTR